jgi:hypothetical protein
MAALAATVPTALQILVVVAVAAVNLAEMAAMAVRALLLFVMRIHIQQQPLLVARRLPSQVVIASTLLQVLEPSLSNGTLCTGKQKLGC